MDMAAAKGKATKSMTGHGPRWGIDMDLCLSQGGANALTRLAMTIVADCVAARQKKTN